MAEGNSGGSSGVAAVAIVVLVILACLAGYVLIRHGSGAAGRSITAAVATPAGPITGKAVTN